MKRGGGPGNSKSPKKCKKKIQITKIKLIKVSKMLGLIKLLIYNLEILLLKNKVKNSEETTTQYIIVE
jgi:hypothetical protein